MKLKNMNFMLPSVAIEGDSDSGASRLMNSFSRYGCRNAESVSDVAATPGVLENI